MSTTPNMGLTKWDLLADLYDHSQLSDNFNKLDRHDHTPGNGVAIKRLGIASYDAGFPSTTGIHNDQLAPDAVTSDKILNGTIQAADIDPATFRSIVPLGTVVAWYRTDPAIPVPSSYAVCDGTAWSSIPNQMGPALASQAAGNIPDLRNKFVLGAATSGTGTSTGTPPAIGAINGSHALNLLHSHIVNAHSHTVDAHTHGTDAHSHSVNAHVHGIPNHHHAFIHPITTFGSVVSETVNWAIVHPNDAHQQTGSTDPIGTAGAVYHDDYNPTLDGLLPTDFATNVMGPISGPVRRWRQTTSSAFNDFGNIVLATDAATSTTSTVAPSTTAAAPGTDTQSPGTTNALSAAQDIRPAHVGLLYIMKVTY